MIRRYELRVKPFSCRFVGGFQNYTEKQGRFRTNSLFVWCMGNWQNLLKCVDLEFVVAITLSI